MSDDPHSPIPVFNPQTLMLHTCVMQEALGCGVMCSHMRHIYDPDTGGCVMDKDITALRVLDINRGPGIST
ncbi:hypothetical protein JOQ06_030377, partial [Pogonophryne albipinna]